MSLLPPSRRKTNPNRSFLPPLQPVHYGRLRKQLPHFRILESNKSDKCPRLPSQSQSQSGVPKPRNRVPPLHSSKTLRPTIPITPVHHIVHHPRTSIKHRIHKPHRPFPSRRALLINERDDRAENGRGQAGAEEVELARVPEDGEVGAVR